MDVNRVRHAEFVHRLGKPANNVTRRHSKVINYIINSMDVA